jgi:hypothetical protein
LDLRVVGAAFGAQPRQAAGLGPEEGGAQERREQEAGEAEDDPGLAEVVAVEVRGSAARARKDSTWSPMSVPTQATTKSKWPNSRNS